MEYIKQHLKLLIKELAFAYETNNMDDFQRLKRQIKEVKEMLNYYENK
jgi:hypothetical protein